ncbi:SDR family NAD(P)-dependent oxidoreductase [Dactylosporangium sp. CA-092794]|uniref:SDR family NAD(P)-dependent oxidoreductase n=1 Tax=Dactylosporangium sp. CA-092794 TaxID=3239929 RepID=UPI003D926EAB
MTDFEGKVAIVTGGASGAGRATAAILARRGAAVVIADINGNAAAETVDELTAAGGRALAVRTDVSSPDETAAVAARAVDEYGRLDVLVNCAAALGPDVLGRDTNVVDVDLDVWRRSLEVDLFGVMLSCRAAIPHLLAAGGGAIVNFSSVAAIRGRWVSPAYAAAKAGIIGLTMNIATTYGHKGIRCNAVAPGLILSPIALQMLNAEDKRIQASHLLLPSQSTPEEVADTAVFLASGAARYVTGQLLVVDGGLTSHSPSYADYFDSQVRFESKVRF